MLLNPPKKRNKAEILKNHNKNTNLKSTIVKFKNSNINKNKVESKEASSKNTILNVKRSNKY